MFAIALKMSATVPLNKNVSTATRAAQTWKENNNNDEAVLRLTANAIHCSIGGFP